MEIVKSFATLRGFPSKRDGAVNRRSLGTTSYLCTMYIWYIISNINFFIIYKDRVFFFLINLNIQLFSIATLIPISSTYKYLGTKILYLLVLHP